MVAAVVLPVWPTYCGRRGMVPVVSVVGWQRGCGNRVVIVWIRGGQSGLRDTEGGHVG